jgi:cephalosporin hydroxylase
MFTKKSKNRYTNSVKFDAKTIHRGHHKTTYKNIPLIKCPFDYLIYHMILWEVKPDYIIEIGTNIGGSALYFSDILDQIGKGVIHTIDIEDKVHPDVKLKKNIEFYFDGFENYRIDELLFKGKTVIVIDDGSHTYPHVIAALNKFKDVVSVNSYFIVEDGILDKLKLPLDYKGGPNKAIKEFIAVNRNYVIDRKYCDLYGINATFNTNGYLKKISL